MQKFFLLVLLVCAFVYSAYDIVTPVFVYRDGDATISGYSGSEKDLYVDGQATNAIAWITFQTTGMLLDQVKYARLSLYTRSVTSPGTLSIYALVNGVTAPENSVKFDLIKPDSVALENLYLGSSFSEKVIEIDISALVKSGNFKGIVLSSDDGLIATFDSKEGNLPPRINLTHSIEGGGVKWLTGFLVPDSLVGNRGDFYLRTINGDVYSKESGVWVLSSSLLGPMGMQGLKGNKGDSGVTGLMGMQGLKGDKGDTGVAGLMGMPGPKGEKGDSGVAGLMGLPGLKGDKGDTGVAGLMGMPGPKGEKGDTGVAGLMGMLGPKGEKGDTGIPGPMGLAGPKGYKGEKGDAGRYLLWRGAWGLDSLYSPNDLAFYDGSSFIAIATSQGKIPADSILYWNLFASKGSVGLQGPLGSTGPIGAVGPAGSQGPKGDTGTVKPGEYVPPPSTFHVVTTASQMVPNNTYIANSSSQVSISLPDSAAVGDFVKVRAQGAGGFNVKQKANQYISAEILNKPVSWVSAQSVQSPYKIISSATGKYLALVEFMGSVFTSDDTGKSWIKRSPELEGMYWRSIASSADGRKIVATSSLWNPAIKGQLVMSNDYGNTWSVLATDAWVDVAISSDGSCIVAIADSENSSCNVFVSVDSGITFIKKDSFKAINKVVLSTDGNRIVLISSGGKIQVSSDKGDSWNESDSVRNWSSVCISGNGKNIYASVDSGHVYVSNDSGKTFVQKVLNATKTIKFWRDFCCNVDGSIAYVIDYSFNFFYYTTDYGATFTKRAFKDPDQWWSMTMSADGSFISAVNINEGNIYTSSQKTSLGTLGGLYSSQAGSTVELVKIDDQQYLLTNFTGVVDGK